MVVSHCLSSRKLPLSGLPPAAAAASAGLHQAAAHTHTKAATLSIWARGDTRRGGGGGGYPHPSRTPAGRCRRGTGTTDRPTERGKGRGRQGRGGGGCPARHLAASPATALLAAAGKAARSLPARAAVCSRPPRAPRPALRPPLAPPRSAPPPPRSAPLPSARHRWRGAGANGLAGGRAAGGAFSCGARSPEVSAAGPCRGSASASASASLPPGTAAGPVARAAFVAPLVAPLCRRHLQAGAEAAGSFLRLMLARRPPSQVCGNP